jgi:hypothetical protein
MSAKQSIRKTNEAIWDGTLLAVVVAAPLPNHHSTEVFVQADPDNGGAVFVGNATSQSVQLNAGDSITIPIDTPSKVYVRSAGSERVNWQAVGR